jgi:putative ABC transport system substrate-binding protein
VARIGWLGGASATSDAPGLSAFRDGLRDRGYVEGRHLVIETRFAEGVLERLPALADELVRAQVDVIVTPGAAPTRAARVATATIPIVIINEPDPVGQGFVASLARPGGQVTGLANVAPELSVKRLELLREVLPGLTRVAVIGTSTTPGYAAARRELERGARALQLQLQILDVLAPADVEFAFKAAARQRADAVVTLNSSILAAQRPVIATQAAALRLPVMFHDNRFVDDGGLMSYGANVLDLSRRAAAYVDLILNGARPAELPVQQPTTFDFVVNLQAAAALGLKIPAATLVRATRVIE